MNAPASSKPGLRLGIRSKILLFGGLPTIIVLIIVITTAIGNMRRGLLSVSKENIQTEVQSTASEINRTNLKSSVVPQVMSIAQESGMFGERENTMRFAEQILRDFPSFTGAYFAYEPDADQQDATYSLAGAISSNAIKPSGQFIPYLSRDIEDPREINLTPLLFMETSYYYQGVKNRVIGRPEAEGIEIVQTGADGEELGRMTVKSNYYEDTNLEMDPEEAVMITEPYIYEGKLIVEQTFPIVMDGEFKGIAGVDRALADLQKFIASLAPFNTADFFLISRRGRIITSTVEGQSWEGGNGTIQIETKTIEESAPFQQILIDAYQSENDFDLFTRKDPQLGKKFFYAVAKIPTGDWTLVMRVAESEVLAPVHRTVFQTIVIAVLGIIVVVLILIWLAGSLSKRIAMASEAASQVADGDLTVDIQEHGTDEAGVLLTAIKQMVSHLNDLLTKVKQASIQVMSTTTKLNATSSQQERVVSDFGASTTEIAAAVKEISATSQQLVRTMDDVKQMVEGTGGLANEGQSRIDGMENAMRSLADATSSISEKLSVISEKANNIGAVVTAITKVADQTNLLSLNAAIEAEKAGEYGLGFAVVAREIRRLADQTAVATLDIEQMVKEMQGSVSSGVMEIDRFTEEVRKGVSETVETSEKFARILESVQGLTPRFEAVYEGMQSQSQGAEQISQAMNGLTDAAKKSSGSLNDLKSASGSLQDAVDELRQEVSRFKVR